MDDGGGWIQSLNPKGSSQGKNPTNYEENKKDCVCKIPRGGVITPIISLSRCSIKHLYLFSALLLQVLLQIFHSSTYLLKKEKKTPNQTQGFHLSPVVDNSEWVWEWESPWQTQQCCMDAAHAVRRLFCLGKKQLLSHFISACLPGAGCIKGKSPFITCSSLTPMCICFSRTRLPLSRYSFPLLFSAELLLVNTFICLLLSVKEVKKKT